MVGDVHIVIRRDGSDLVELLQSWQVMVFAFDFYILVHGWILGNSFWKWERWYKNDNKGGMVFFAIVCCCMPTITPKLICCCCCFY